MAKPKKTKVDDTQIINDVLRGLKDANGIADTTQGDKAARALRAFTRGRLDSDIDKNGNLKKRIGKSEFVSQDVYERTRWFLSGLTKIFDGQEQVVLFQGQTSDDDPLAAQQTAVCNFIARQKNSHIAFLSDWGTDGLLNGFAVAYVEFVSKKKQGLKQTVKGVSDDALMHFYEQQEQGLLKIVGQSDEYETSLIDQPAADALPPMVAILKKMKIKVRDLEIRYLKKNITLNIKSLKPEMFFVSKNAQINQQTGGIDADLIGHMRITNRAELKACGFNKEKVDSIPLAADSADSAAIERSKGADWDQGVGDVHEDVTVYEVYTKLDLDGELRDYKITLAGSLSAPVLLTEPEEVSDIYPYAPFVPFPVPHTLFGLGMIDIVGPEQNIISKFTRLTHDSANMAVDPVKIYNPDAAKRDDLTNLYPGKAIPSDQPDAGIKFLQTPFAGNIAMQVIQDLKQTLDYTTGVGGAMMAVNASDLQNATATGVTQRANAQQMLMEQTARHWADTGYRYLFRIIIDLLRNNHEDAAEFIGRLQGNYVDYIDQWDPDMDLTANIAFGVTDRMNTMANLQIVAGVQQQAQAMGLADREELHATWTKMIETAGFKNTAQFVKDPKTTPPPPPPAPPVDPNAGLVEIEKLKAQLKAESDERDRQMEFAIERLRNDLSRDKNDMDFAIDAAKVQGQYHTQVDTALVEREIAAGRHDVDFAIAAQASAADLIKRRAEMDAEKQAQVQQAAQAAQAQQTPPDAPMTPPQQ